MKIEIKKSIKPVEYTQAIQFLERRLQLIKEDKEKELIWTLEHPLIYTGGTSYKNEEILDNSINLIKSNRGGKVTLHNKGQLVCYFLINLSKRKKDIRKFINLIENVIIETLSQYEIESFNDKNDIGIWTKQDNEIKKIGAIGIRVSSWIAYHGFSININNNLLDYEKIIPCGIKNKSVINLKSIKDQDYSDLENKLIKNFIKYLEILVF